MQSNYIPYDEVVIPTVKKKMKEYNQSLSQMGVNSNGDYDEYENSNYDDQSSSLPLIEELSKEQMQSYELFLKYIDEQALQKLLSKHIYYKEEGIDILINEIPYMFYSPSITDIKAMLSLILKTIMAFLEEKHPITIIKAFDILWTLLEHIKQNEAKINTGFTLSDRLLNLIKKRISDTNIKVRNKAIDLYCFLLTLPFCDYNNLINELLVNDIKYAEVNPLSSLQIISNLIIIGRVLKDFNKAFQSGLVDLNLFPYYPITQFLKMNVTNNKSEIRKLSRQLISKFIRQFGLKRIALELLNISPRELIKLKEEIPELKAFIESHSKHSPNSNSSNKSISNYSVSPNDDYKSGIPSESRSRSKSPILKKDKCRFCKGVVLVSHAKDLEMHKEFECLMFTQCNKCEEVIEVKKLTSHLLNECNFKNEFQQCTRCKEPIMIDDYVLHIESNACLPLRELNGYNRCPLCHKDIPPTDRGFYTHLIVDGCPKQSRKYF